MMRTLLRVIIIDNPLLLFLILALPSVGLLACGSGPDGFGARLTRIAGLLRRPALVLALAGYAGCVLAYAALPHLVEHLESTIMINSWFVVQGRPLYPAPETGQI